MRVCVVLEHRFFSTADGAVWTNGMFPRSFWDRYLSEFDRVRVLARVGPMNDVPQEWSRADGEAIAFAPVPYFIGPAEYLRRARAVRRAVRRAIDDCDAVILRVSSHLASILHPTLVGSRHPYGVEVVVDPYDMFAPGSVRHALRPFFRWWFSRTLRRQCHGACASAYVTAASLQQRYPPAPGTFTMHCSDVQLDGFVADKPRRVVSKRPWRLITVGTLAQLYKGIDVLIDAVARCRQEGLDLQLVVVGEGKHRAELEARAGKLGLSEQIFFRGQLSSGPPIRAELERADLFVLPSRQEGLPRAMVEAMAAAMPCVGSAIGGIPELLSPQDMCPGNDVGALATKIREVLADPDRMTQMSARNLVRAREYSEAELGRRRADFYRHLRTKTQEWLDSKRNASTRGVAW
jgi:glycosyltransferase involved in cell wall biosynthesis